MNGRKNIKKHKICLYYKKNYQRIKVLKFTELTLSYIKRRNSFSLPFSTYTKPDGNKTAVNKYCRCLHICTTEL